MPIVLPIALLSMAPTAAPSPKSILITGATEGLGLTAAQQLARKGHTVLVHGRNDLIHATNIITVKHVVRAHIQPYAQRWQIFLRGRAINFRGA